MSLSITKTIHVVVIMNSSIQLKKTLMKLFQIFNQINSKMELFQNFNFQWHVSKGIPWNWFWVLWACFFNYRNWLEVLIVCVFSLQLFLWDTFNFFFVKKKKSIQLLINFSLKMNIKIIFNFIVILVSLE